MVLRLARILYWLLALGLLGLVLFQVDLAAAWDQAWQVGWGMLWLLALYFAAFLIDSYTWQMALVEVSLGPRWLYRTWKVRMVGEVFNTVIPAAGFGGEPVKAELLKKHYGIDYRAGAASLILAKTINTLALVLFLAVGFALMWGAPQLGSAFHWVAAAGLGAFALGAWLFYAVQRWQASSLAGTWLAGFRFARRFDDALHHVRDMDERLMRFYTRYKGRFAGALFLAWVNWALGAVEIYYTLLFLGHPVTLAEAWIIESATQLVRAGAFFIPAGIGAQEGTFLVILAAMTGSPTLGAAVAVVRRFREVLWLVWGALLGFLFTKARLVIPTGQ
ncbi:MAG: lysylphosphatidylglycerol synthase domain-containing protein [Magnetospirillum sp. WYHS-4]